MLIEKEKDLRESGSGITEVKIIVYRQNIVTIKTIILKQKILFSTDCTTETDSGKSLH